VPAQYKSDRNWLRQAEKCRIEATTLPPGATRDAVLRQARQFETASLMNEWLLSPGLRPPD
jgi:hypothetical protein